MHVFQPARASIWDRLSRRKSDVVFGVHVPMMRACQAKASQQRIGLSNCSATRPNASAPERRNRPNRANLAPGCLQTPAKTSIDHNDFGLTWDKGAGDRRRDGWRPGWHWSRHRSRQAGCSAGRLRVVSMMRSWQRPSQRDRGEGRAPVPSGSIVC